MEKIDRILKYIENQKISISSFERKTGLTNSYLNNTKKRGEDISAKMLERIRKRAPNDYYKIFPEEKREDSLQEPNLGFQVQTIEPCEKFITENDHLKKLIDKLEVIIQSKDVIIESKNEIIDSKNEIITLQRSLLGGNTNPNHNSA